jgi:predicted O-methyltransferase YrrM
MDMPDWAYPNSMDTVTKFISEKLGLPIEKEYMDDTRTAFDTGSVEHDVGELYYSLIRIIHPLNVLETGSYKGISGVYIGMALKENGQGKLESIEFNSELMRIAKERWVKMELQDIIQEHLMDSLTFIPNKEYDMLFLDTEPQIRLSELKRFWKYLKPGGYVVIHDFWENFGEHKTPWEDWEDFREYLLKCQWISFHTRRGLMIGQKNREGMAYI